MPMYGAAEVGHYLALPASTIRAWSGAGGRAGLITPAKREPLTLSFWNLVEIYVIATIRRHHQVDMAKLRTALDFAERELGTPRPLIHQAFLTDGVHLFVEELGRLINASRRGQLAIRKLIDSSLSRIERDEEGLAMRVFPWRGDPTEPAYLELNPMRASGRLAVVGTGIPTEVLASRARAGDSVDALARDYGIEREKIAAALAWEEVPAAA